MAAMAHTTERERESEKEKERKTHETHPIELANRLCAYKTDYADHTQHILLYRLDRMQFYIDFTLP